MSVGNEPSRLGVMTLIVVVLVVFVAAWPVVAAVVSFLFTAFFFGGVPALVLLLLSRAVTRIGAFLESRHEPPSGHSPTNQS